MFVVLRKEAAMFKLQTYIELLYSLKWTIMLGLMRQTKHFLLMFVLWWAWWELTLGPDPMAPRCSWSGQWAVGSAPGCWVLGAHCPEPRAASPVGSSIWKWTQEVKHVVVCSLQGASGATAARGSVEEHKARCIASIRNANWQGPDEVPVLPVLMCHPDSEQLQIRFQSWEGRLKAGLALCWGGWGRKQRPEVLAFIWTA